MNDAKEQAIQLLKDFKGENYAFGTDVLGQVGRLARQLGRSALVIANPSGWLQQARREVCASLDGAGVSIDFGTPMVGARPNSPREDVYRIESYILHSQPQCIVVIGGGSSIDATKASNVLACLGRHDPNLDSYMGVGKVTEALAKTGSKLIPLLAVQTASASGAHLTKYSNITDLATGQKKLIIDEAVIPARAVFDYGLTRTAPAELTVDGALDGMSHCLEVFYGIGPKHFDLLREIVSAALTLLLRSTPVAVKTPDNLDARTALGLATDLGGYAIMVGGTSGGHLTSFSLVDVAAHGRACGIMNPYYTVFFAPAIPKQLRIVGDLFKQAGFIRGELDRLAGRDLGMAVAEGMIAFQKSLGAPTTLAELPGFTDAHIARALSAAKDPQLASKLQNMPIPLTAGMIDDYMAPVLQAAKTGRFELIKNIPA
jgi:alcohol dehydrogenase class IV